MNPVIGEQDRIELPKKFNGYPIKLIGRVHVYEKGHDFPAFDSGWTCVPTGYRPGTWNMVLRYFPNKHSLIEKAESAPKEVVLGKTKIDEYAFAGCTSISSMSFPNDVEIIGDHAFDGCSDLESVIVWGKNTVIGSDAFANCPKLSRVPS